ncbi:MAG: enoyl-CoA hydratase/isomerase family protein, partial [Chloroflexota bacterium]
MPDYGRFPTLLTNLDDGVLTVTLNRPERLNAVDRETHRSLEDLWDDVAGDANVRAVVLTGAGRAFCAGGDVRAMAERSGAATVTTVSPFMGGGGVQPGARRLILNMLEVNQPIIAALNGDTIGLGATIALLSDITIAADTARIGDPHVRVGLVAGDGGAVIWPLLIGIHKAKELLMTGRLISAVEAERIGLINEVHPLADVLPAAQELARSLADGPTMAEFQKLQAEVLAE